MLVIPPALSRRPSWRPAAGTFRRLPLLPRLLRRRTSGARAIGVRTARELRASHSAATHSWSTRTTAAGGGPPPPRPCARASSHTQGEADANDGGTRESPLASHQFEILFGDRLRTRASFHSNRTCRRSRTHPRATPVDGGQQRIVRLQNGGETRPRVAASRRPVARPDAHDRRARDADAQRQRDRSLRPSTPAGFLECAASKHRLRITTVHGE